MTQENEPTKCPQCGSNEKQLYLPKCQGKYWCGAAHDWHREPAAPLIKCEFTGEEIPLETTCSRGWTCNHTRESAAPPAGMTAAELEAEWLAQSEHLDYRNWLQVKVIYLRGEVERVTQESIQYDELREQQIWQLEDALARLRERLNRLKNSIPAIWSPDGLALWLAEFRTALESTTPQEEK